MRGPWSTRLEASNEQCNLPPPPNPPYLLLLENASSSEMPLAAALSGQKAYGQTASTSARPLSQSTWWASREFYFVCHFSFSGFFLILFSPSVLNSSPPCLFHVHFPSHLFNTPFVSCILPSCPLSFIFLLVGVSHSF